ETNTATKDLVIYPSHYILKPNESRKVRISARTKEFPALEKPYRVTIKELPVSFREQGAEQGVYMAISYKTACYLLPQKPTARLKLSQAKIENNKLSLFVTNEGNAHQHLGNPIITLQDNLRKTLPIDIAAMQTRMSQENVHAGKGRRFVID